MAKIPRINQGDRPSTARVDTTIGPDKSMSTLFSGIADVAGAGAVAALNVEAAEQAERNAALVAEQKRLKEAADAKQKIVDASNEGVVNMEFENESFKTLQELESEFADNPDVIPQEYRKRMDERQKELMARQDLNDTVKLGAVKNAESTMSSGLRQSYSITNSLQTKKVKGNLARSVNEYGNTAANMSSPAAVAALTEKFRAKELPNFIAVYGKDAEAEIQKAEKSAFRAWGEVFSDTNPYDFLRMQNDPILKKSLGTTDMQALRKSAEVSADGAGKRQRRAMILDGIERGNEVALLLKNRVLRAEDIISHRNRIIAEKENIAVSKFTDEQKKEQMKVKDRDLELLNAVELTYRGGMDDNLAPPDKLDEKLMLERDRLFGKKSKKAKSVEELLEYRNKVYLAEARGQISPGHANTLKDEANDYLGKAAKKLRENKGWIFPSADEVAANTMNKLFNEQKPENDSPETRNLVSLKFIELKNAALMGREELSDDEAEQLAYDAFFKFYGKTAPQRTKK